MQHTKEWASLKKGDCYIFWCCLSLWFWLKPSMKQDVVEKVQMGLALYALFFQNFIFNAIMMIYNSEGFFSSFYSSGMLQQLLLYRQHMSRLVWIDFISLYVCCFSSLLEFFFHLYGGHHCKKWAPHLDICSAFIVIDVMVHWVLQLLWLETFVFKVISFQIDILTTPPQFVLIIIKQKNWSG